MYSFCIEVSLQDKQSSGPFNFPGSSSLMRGCRNLNNLSFECCDWSACVASESWGELPVPPAEVIARGTQGVFLFVKTLLMGGIMVSGVPYLIECEHMELSRRNLHDDDLLPLLEGLRVGKFSRLMILNLVIYIYIYDCVQYDENAAGCDSCAAG